MQWGRIITQEGSLFPVLYKLLDQGLISDSKVQVPGSTIIWKLRERHVCSLLAEKLPTPVRRIGVNDEYGHSGPAVDLLKQFGLCAEHIVEVAKDFCK